MKRLQSKAEGANQYEVYAKNGYREELIGVYEANTLEEAKELAGNDVSYGWYVTQAVEPGTVSKFKITYLNGFIGKEETTIIYAENEEAAKEKLHAKEVYSIERL